MFGDKFYNVAETFHILQAETTFKRLVTLKKLPTGGRVTRLMKKDG